VVIVPKDRFGNQVGPGKGDGIDFGGGPGTVVTGPPEDKGDGSYEVPVEWEPGAPQGPGIVVTQPERPPVVVHDPSAAGSGKGGEWPWWLIWLLLLIILILLVLLAIALLT
jgi:hypothetical protein